MDAETEVIVATIAEQMSQAYSKRKYLSDIKGEIVTLTPDSNKISYYIENVRSSLIVLTNKINKLFIRGCRDINVVSRGTISGIDVLACNSVSVSASVPHQWINLEYVTNGRIHGDVTVNTLVSVLGSQRVWINDRRVRDNFGDRLVGWGTELYAIGLNVATPEVVVFE